MAKATAKKTKILQALNEVKRAEVTAVLTFMAHEDALRNLGLDVLAELYHEEAVEEMGHANKIAERIYFLGGEPDPMPLVKPAIGQDLVRILKNDIAMEAGQIERIKKVVRLAWEDGDAGTRTMLETILTDEEHHFADLSNLLENFQKYGFEYLAYMNSAKGDAPAH
jgi:bacterioferritin